VGGSRLTTLDLETTTQLPLMEKPLLLLLLLLFNLANLYTPRGHQKFAKSVVSGRQLVYGAQHSGNNVQENIYTGMKM